MSFTHTQPGAADLASDKILMIAFHSISTVRATFSLSYISLLVFSYPSLSLTVLGFLVFFLVLLFFHLLLTRTNTA